jgi:hypothetical protein
MAFKLIMRRALVAVLVVMALASSRPASAQTQETCMSQLTSCYYWAATQAGFWTMWASGIDCEFQMIECIRRSIIGH